MKGCSFNDFGSPSEIILADLPMPEVGDNEVLVKVRGVSVNHVDTFVRNGRFKTPLHNPKIIGRDLVGTVEAKGCHVHGFSLGESVWSNSMGYEGRPGAAAEFVAVPQNRLYKVPAGVDGLKLVASVHPAATAAVILQNIIKNEARKTILVAGAAGHVGTKLVRIAALSGAAVLTTSSAADFGALKKLGATCCYDYNDFLLPVKDDFPSGVDYVIDTSSRVPLGSSMQVLADFGTVVMMTTPPEEQLLNFSSFYMRDQRIQGFVISHASAAELAQAADTLNKFFEKNELLEENILVKPFSDAAWAHEMLETNQIRKERIVLVPKSIPAGFPHADLTVSAACENRESGAGTVDFV